VVRLNPHQRRLVQGLLTGVAEGMVEGLGEPMAEVEGLTPGFVG
jgi:hypothetical protein